MAAKPGKKKQATAAKARARNPKRVAADRVAANFTSRIKSFCDHHLALGESNASEAARRAGYSHARAHKSAHENLQRPDVQAYLTARRAPVISELLAKHQVSVQRVLEEAAISAFSDIADVATLANGQFQPKDFKDMDAAARRNIASITAAPGMFGMKYTVKLYDKGSAQDRLTKLLGMVPPEMTDLTMAERAELLARIIENGTRRKLEHEQAQLRAKKSAKAAK